MRQDRVKRRQIIEVGLASAPHRSDLGRILRLEHEGIPGDPALDRDLENEIADPLAEMLLQGKFHAGDTVRIHPAEGKLVIEKAEAEERKPEPVAP